MRAPEHRDFHPRRARVVGFGVAIGIVLVMVGVSIGLSLSPDSGWTWSDTVSALVFAALVAGGLVRLVTVRARVTEAGLVVRNVVYTREVEWGAVVAVRFGGADPWLTLDTDDGENLAVMAVQRADGEYAKAEALRLARLVEAHAPKA
ncbi:PH domain-containing protein [Kineococcus sp. SYSU DK003]|uniref:PH domain-containing protein n=1 Tax=Kineococcus sp. SYSU DK003 TaxID=3383124 RepID=UPI003D7CA8AD